MTQSEMKNAGYRIVRSACIAKGFTVARETATVSAYVTAVRAHDEVNATMVHLIALNIIENA